MQLCVVSLLACGIILCQCHTPHASVQPTTVNIPTPSSTDTSLSLSSSEDSNPPLTSLFPHHTSTDIEPLALRSKPSNLNRPGPRPSPAGEEVPVRTESLAASQRVPLASPPVLTPAGSSNAMGAIGGFLSFLMPNGRDGNNANGEQSVLGKPPGADEDELMSPIGGGATRVERWVRKASTLNADDAPASAMQLGQQQIA
eukprot:3941935-Rhodomonas_salina.1